MVALGAFGLHGAQDSGRKAKRQAWRRGTTRRRTWRSAFGLGDGILTARTKATQHQMETGGTTDERQGVNPCGHNVEHLAGNHRGRRRGSGRCASVRRRRVRSADGRGALGRVAEQRATVPSPEQHAGRETGGGVRGARPGRRRGGRPGERAARLLRGRRAPTVGGRGRWRRRSWWRRATGAVRGTGGGRAGEARRWPKEQGAGGAGAALLAAGSSEGKGRGRGEGWRRRPVAA